MFDKILSTIVLRATAMLKRVADYSRYAKFALIGALLVGLSGWGMFLNYYLPSHTIVKINDTDVKRMDDDFDIKTLNPLTSRDVRFISAETEDGKSHVYRNEDTGWDFPFYFKFDSADISAEAQKIKTRSPDSWVLLTHYGWRIDILSMFPNVTEMKVIEDPHKIIIPWFNIFVLLLIHGIPGYALWRLYRMVRRMIQSDAPANAGVTDPSVGEKPAA